MKKANLDLSLLVARISDIHSLLFKTNTSAPARFFLPLPLSRPKGRPLDANFRVELVHHLRYGSRRRRQRSPLTIGVTWRFPVATARFESHHPCVRAGYTQNSLDHFVTFRTGSTTRSALCCCHIHRCRMVAGAQRIGSYPLRVTWDELGRDPCRDLRRVIKMKIGVGLRVEAAGRGRERRNSPAKGNRSRQSILEPLRTKRGRGWGVPSWRRFTIGSCKPSDLSTGLEPEGCRVLNNGGG